jgi:hypothetical protein
VSVSAAAQSQEAGPLDGRQLVADGSTVALADRQLQPGTTTAEVPASRRDDSRWQRVRNAVWPLRPRRQRPDSERSTREEPRARWLLGRDIRYAPGVDPDSPRPLGPEADTSLSKVANEQLENSGQPRGVAAPAAASADERVQVPLDPGQNLRDLPPDLLPLPSPTLPSAGQPGTSEGTEAVADASVGEVISGSQREPYGFGKRFLRGYSFLVDWFPEWLGPPREEPPPTGERTRPGETRGGGGAQSTTSRRRVPPSPWESPPFPTSEYQGYPLIGVPPSPNTDPLQEALYFGPYGDAIKESRLEVHGWITSSGNWSNANRSNLPTAYWIVPNSYQLDQAVIKLEREVDWAQTDHVDWGFRSVHLYGIDYRYTTAGGWFSQQLLYHNNLYGYDPVELYFELYIPRIFEGMQMRVGRWIACPDIETQYAPDNYMATHSLLFTFDTYTQTGVMFSFQLNQRNMVQGAIHSGTDMAPWYPGALPTGFFGWRWVSASNNDSLYTCLNNINNANFRYFMADGRKAGHDNFNYIVSTWTHRFSKKVHTNTEAYYMWQNDAVLGGTPSLAPPMSFGGGGGLGKFIPGTSRTYGVLNYTLFGLSTRDYVAIRNEWWRDEQGERSGFPSNYTSNTIGLSHQFCDNIMIRPEIGYYHSWNVPAFNLGKSKDLLMYGFDFTIRF